MNETWVNGFIDISQKQILRVAVELSPKDRWNNLKVKWGFKRMTYRVKPGLYGVGEPDADSPVLVTANYKLTFDRVRQSLSRMNVWLLVLNTRGINVWCAAGKGTFGTDELVKRIKYVELEQVVRHRRLIVPQLGANGVSAHQVKKRSGFSVVYGPVRIEDISGFFKNNLQATEEMRQVRFNLKDRLDVVPVEITQGLPKLLAIMAVIFLLSGFGSKGYQLANLTSVGARGVVLLGGAFFAGVFVGPTLLPWLPGRSFSMKGFFSGSIMFLGLMVLLGFGTTWFEIIAWFLMMTAISSFLTMNYTGASTYTSLSGVKKEMRVAVPLQLVSAVAGLSLWIVSRFVAA